MDPRLVDVQLVAQTLRLSTKTLEGWNRQGPLKIIQEGNGKYYVEDEIDQLLKANPVGPGEPFTWAKIVAEKISFLTSTEVEKELGISASEVGRRGRSGALTAVKFGRNVRYTAQSVQIVRQGVATVSRKQAGHILGVSSISIKTLTRLGHLHSVRAEREVRTTLDSIVALLPSFLPPWITPMAWIAFRQRQKRGFIAASALAAIHGPAYVNNLVNNRKIPYIRPSVTGQIPRILLPLDSVDAYMKLFPWTSRTLAPLFGVTFQDIKEWDEDFVGWRACDCNLHSPDDKNLYRPCVLALIERYVQGGKSFEWLLQQQHNSNRLISESQAMRLLKIAGPDTLTSLARQHSLMYIVRPDGSSGFPFWAVRKLRTKSRRAARSE